MTKRNDKVWLCAGCTHGFMFTTRDCERERALFTVGEVKTDDKGNPLIKDTAVCLCAHPALVSVFAESSAETAAQAERRVRLYTQVIACEGFTARDITPAQMEPKS